MIVASLLLLAAFSWYWSRYWSRPKVVIKSGWLQKAPDGRKWGHWKPSTFRYPPVTPAEFDLANTQPPMYRAFKYKHTVIMDAREMPWDRWIELDCNFPRYHRLRADRLAARGRRVCDTLPGAETAVRELCVELAEFLVARYPDVYRVDRRGPGWFGPDEIRQVTIVPLNATYEMDTQDPMEIAGSLSPVDIAVMMEGEDSLYYMRAGMIALAGSWRLEDKLGKDLFAIHTSGNVPDRRQAASPDHQRLTPEKPGWRNNYTLTVSPGDELAWATSTEGPEDSFQQGHRGDPPQPADPSTVQIRQERQTLRRLPRSGAVVFTIHSYSEPLSALAAEPGVPGRLASAVASWKGEVDDYKNGQRYQKVIPYLEDMHAKQLELGITGDRPDPAWKYPY